MPSVPAQPSRSLPRRALVALAAASLGIGAAVLAAAGPAGAASQSAVLSEVYGGGGNSGASYRNDFAELANRGASAVDVSTWSVQYLPATASSTATWQVTALTGTIAAGDNYLVGEASGGTTGADLPATQVNGTINFSGTSGTVALVRSTTALTCKTAADCAADPNVVDLVGYGTAVVREKNPTAALSNTTSASRTAAADSDDNSADFTVGAPSPTGSTTSAPPQPGPLRIHDIQGNGWLSPDAKKSVTNVPGIVTATRTSSSRGFWFQDPNPDSDPATSEGVFVFTSSAPTVQPGDSVLVSGTVSEFYPGSDSSVLSVTEIGSPTVTVLSSGNPLPAAIALTPTTVPDQYAPDLGGGNIESTPVTPSRSALDFYESIEGMRAQVTDARVVGPSNDFGEQYVTTKPDQARTYRGGTELLAENATPSGRLEIKTDGASPGVSVGDVFTGVTAGPIDYSNFGGYLIFASTLGTVARTHPAPVVATRGSDRQLTVATYNVENLDPVHDPQSKFDRLAEGIVTNLASPDIVTLEEVQDNTGSTDDGTVAADVTLNRLVEAITAHGGRAYRYAEIDPVNDQDGGEPGGNIRVAFLYDPNRVSFVHTGDASVNRSTTATQPQKVRGGVGLTLSPGRIDPTNPVWTTSRKPLVGQFLFNGRTVFVIANHFDSKGGDQSADGRYQYPARSSETQRAGQAAAVHDFVSALLKLDRSAEVVVLGDLNDYQFSPALQILKTGTAAGSSAPILTDLINGLPVDQRYTYVYNGVSQVLDHILVSSRIDGGRGLAYQVIHLNSEYADQTSDHDPQVLAFTP